MMLIKRIAPDDYSLSRLSVAMGGYDDFYLAELQAGRAELWEVQGGESYAITRIEFDEVRGPVLVLCCYEGKQVEAFTRQLQQAAKVMNVNGIRCHCSRPGFKRIAKRLNFHEIEQVYYYGL